MKEKFTFFSVTYRTSNYEEEEEEEEEDTITWIMRGNEGSRVDTRYCTTTAWGDFMKVEPHAG